MKVRTKGVFLMESSLFPSSDLEACFVLVSKEEPSPGLAGFWFKLPAYPLQLKWRRCREAHTEGDKEPSQLGILLNSPETLEPVRREML